MKVVLMKHATKTKMATMTIYWYTVLFVHDEKSSRSSLLIVWGVWWPSRRVMDSGWRGEDLKPSSCSVLEQDIFEPLHKKSNSLHRRKQRRRSASLRS